MHKLKILRYNNRKWPENGAQALPTSWQAAFVYLSKTLYAFCLPITNNSNKRGLGSVLTLPIRLKLLPAAAI